MLLYFNLFNLTYMKYFVLLLAIIGLSGCASVSKQYYYVPSVTHQTLRDHYRHSDFKMIYSQVKISSQAGDSIGTITTDNGVGHPLLMGPVIFPVIPVGGFFQKIDGGFSMSVNINCNNKYFMPLAIDSNAYKRKRDSLNSLKISTEAPLSNGQCYMIGNDTLKIPLHVKEFFMGYTTGHSYAFTSDIRFRKVNTMKLVTGNALLDSTLKNITFKRKSRIKFEIIGPGV